MFFLNDLGRIGRFSYVFTWTKQYKRCAPLEDNISIVRMVKLYRERHSAICGFKTQKHTKNEITIRNHFKITYNK